MQGDLRERHFRIGAVGVTLATDVSVVRDAYMGLYGEFERMHAPGRAIRIDVSRGARRWCGVRGYRVAVNGRDAFAPPRLAQVIPYVEWGINWEVPRAMPEFLQLHASSMEVGGQGIVLAGDSGSGKSTLTAGLMRRGWRYLCDELALVRADTLALHPYPRAICIKEGAFGVLDSLGVAVASRAGYVKGAKGRVVFINPLAIRPGSIGRVCPIRYVIFPQYTAGATPSLIPMSRGEAAFALHRVCFNLFGCERLGIDVLAAVVRGAACFRLTAGSIDSTCDLLESLSARDGEKLAKTA